MFSDKTVVITGAASGIGFAIAKKFLDQGAKIAIADISEKKGKHALNELSFQAEKSIFIQTDTGNAQSIQNMVDKTTEALGDISILVNCAACFAIKGLMDATPADWEKMCRVNIIGYALCAKYCVPSMINLGKGAIINIGSASGVLALPNMVTYATTKGAIDSMTRCMAVDLTKYNIRVNAINPGTVWTDDCDKRYGLTRDAADQHPAIGGAHILQRTQSPEEVADVALFLASEKASFITAESIMVDGGAHCYKNVKVANEFPTTD